MTEPSRFTLLFLESRLVNGIFRGGGSEEPRKGTLGTGPATTDSDSSKKLISKHKAEKYNMMSGDKETKRYDGDTFCQAYEQIVIGNNQQ